jgi:hypothetical protein
MRRRRQKAKAKKQKSKVIRCASQSFNDGKAILATFAFPLLPFAFCLFVL